MLFIKLMKRKENEQLASWAVSTIYKLRTSSEATNNNQAQAYNMQSHYTLAKYSAPVSLKLYSSTRLYKLDPLLEL